MKHGKVHDFLEGHHMGILSTVSDEGKPWGSAINFVIDEDLNFFFMTRAETLKFKNIEQNPTVALTVTDEENQITVQTQGEISKVETKDIMDIVFKKLARVRPRGDHSWVPPVIKVHKGDYMVLCLKPTKLQYADFKQHKTDVFDEYIEQII